MTLNIRIKKYPKGYVVQTRFLYFFWVDLIKYRGSTETFYYSGYSGALAGLLDYVKEETRWE